MNTQIYKNTDNTTDILLKNKENILFLLHLLETIPTGDIHPKPREFKTANDLLNNAELGELGRYIEDNGQITLGLKGSNGIVAKWKNEEELKQELAKQKAEIVALIDKVNEVSVYHFGTIDDANAAKSTITFKENDIAWIGTTGAWTGYHLTGGNWVANGTTSTHTATVDAYTKAEADAKFAGKIYDYSGTPIPLNFNDSGGSRYQIITKPASENAPSGAEIKLFLTSGATDPNQIPQDTDQITYGVDLLWINQKTTNIMNWSEIKNNIADGKIMVITKISTGNYQLVRWEEKAPSIGDVVMDDGTIIDLENIGITTK